MRTLAALCAAAIAVGCSGRPHTDGSRVTANIVPMTPPGPSRVELGMPIGERVGGNGRFVAFIGPRDRDPWARGLVYLVVDSLTGASLTFEHVRQIAFAPDRQHLIVSALGNLVVYELATGNAVGAPAAIENLASFAPDGRLAWAEPAGKSYPIHLRNLATRAETILTGMPAFGGGRADRVRLAFDQRAHVLATTERAIRVWKNDRPDPIVAVEGETYNHAMLSSDGLAYVRIDDRLQHFFEHIDLASAQRKPIRLVDLTCGRASMSRYSRFRRCAENQYLVVGPRSFCVWDTARGRLQAHFAPIRREYHCSGDRAWVGDKPPYTVHSVTTGKQLSLPSDGLVEEDQPRWLADLAIPKNEDPIPKVIRERASLWSTTNHMLWQSPAPSEAAAITFTQSSELVAVGRNGHIWRVDLATRTMRTAKLADCEIVDAGAIASAPDGRVAAACVHGANRELQLEGVKAPLFAGADLGWHPAAAATASASTIGWLSSTKAHAWSLPDGKERWAYDAPRYGFALTADGGSR